MLSKQIADHLKTQGYTWKIAGRDQHPTDSDLEKVLDKAAGVLYDGSIGDRIDVGHLIIERTHGGYRVYVEIGEYT